MRHLLTVHMAQSRVQDIKLLPKISKQRAVLQEILNEGNFEHNCKVLKEGVGLLVVARRNVITSETVHRNPGDFVPCEFCKGFFVTNRLWHHVH